MLIGSSKMRFYGCNLLCYEEQSDIIDWLKWSIEHAVRSGETEVSVQKLFGGENWDWKECGFPIQLIWDKFYEKYCDDKNIPHGDESDMTFEQAARSVGRLFKIAILKSKYTFKMKKAFRSTIYILVTDDDIDSCGNKTKD